MVAWALVQKRVVKTAASRKAKTATPGIRKRLERNKQVRYKTRVFKCWGDYHTCCEHGDWKACAAWLALCITNELKALGLGPAAYIGVKFLIGH